MGAKLEFLKIFNICIMYELHVGRKKECRKIQWMKTRNKIKEREITKTKSKVRRRVEVALTM